MTKQVGDWQWNIWELDPKTGRPCKWHGMIRDPQGAFTWMDKNGGRSKFVCNNVPPSAKGRERITTVVRATSAKEFVDDGVQPKNHFPKPVTPTPVVRAVPKVDFSRKSDFNTSGQRVPAQRKPQPAPKPVETKETTALKKDAAVLLEDHKKAERAELEAELKDGE